MKTTNDSKTVRAEDCIKKYHFLVLLMRFVAKKATTTTKITNTDN